MPEGPSRRRFLLHPALRARFVVLDGEAVAFNPHTWETHLLNAAAASIAERISCEPASAVEISLELFGETADDETVGQVSGVLEDLARLGLIDEQHPR